MKTSKSKRAVRTPSTSSLISCVRALEKLWGLLLIVKSAASALVTRVIPRK